MKFEIEIEIVRLMDYAYVRETILKGLDDEAHVGVTLCNYMRGIIELAEQAEALKNG